jgi:carboxymethylenebutenolidase
MRRLNAYQRYLVEEFADEYRERQMSRRELLRRVLIVTGSVPLTASVLTALGCGSDADDEADETVASGTSPAGTTAATPTTAGATPSEAPPDSPAVTEEDIEFEGPASPLFGRLAMPSVATAPGILVIHENRGLNDHIREVAARYAAEGFVALAVDLVSRNGGSTEDTNANMGFLSSLDGAAVREDLSAYALHLQGLEGVQAGGIGVVGYCLGGGYTWEAAVGVPGVRAAVPYYGPCAVIDELADSEAAILAIYGESDSRVTSQAEEVRAALEARGLPYEVQIYPGAGHAFFNDTGQNYNAEAAADAFDRTVAWFEEYLA